jgi:hypothetical protein
MTAGFAPYAALSASGGDQQAREQALIQDAQSQHSFEQNLPYNKLSQYTGALSGTQGLLGPAGVTTAPGRGPMSTMGSLAQIGSLAFNPTNGFLRSI